MIEVSHTGPCARGKQEGSLGYLASLPAAMKAGRTQVEFRQTSSGTALCGLWCKMMYRFLQVCALPTACQATMASWV